MKKLAAITGIIAFASFVTASAFAGTHHGTKNIKTKPQVSTPKQPTHHSNAGHH